MKLVMLSVSVLLAIGTEHANAEPPSYNCLVVPTEILGGCVAPSAAGKGDDTQIYTGLQVAFGNGSFVPKLVLGARHTTASNENVYGLDASVRFTIKDNLSIDSSILSVIGGRANAIGGAGIGYSYSENSMMTMAALETAYLRAGVDYVFSLSSPTFFIEANTIKKHEGNATACGSGYYSRTADYVSTVDGPKPELLSGDFLVIGQEAAAGAVTCVPTVNPLPVW